MRPGPTDPWTKRSELFVRRWVVRVFGALVHRRRAAPGPEELSTARVLLIRQDRIGDVLVSTPLIAALRQALPGLTLDMLVSTNNQVAVAGVHAIRHAWVYERSFPSMLMLLRSIRREHYDVAVDLMDNPSATATAFCVLSGARWTMGLAKENDYSYDVRIPLMSRRDRHIIERLAPIAEAFGISAAHAIGPVVYVPKTSSRTAARETYESLQCLGRRKLGVNISAGSERRYWGTDRFRAIVQYLHMTEPSAAIIILCKPSDHARACGIASVAEGAIVLPPHIDFDGFAASVEHLDALVTPDTSVVHLASAFRVPSVALYIQSNPDLRIWEPYGSPHVPVVTTVDDLRTITLDQVTRAWQELRGMLSSSRSIRSNELAHAR